MAAALAALLQMAASLQPDTVDSQVVLWEMDMVDSCFCPCVLLYWVWSEIEISMCAGMAKFDELAFLILRFNPEIISVEVQ
jgi:hypothetical protein